MVEYNIKEDMPSVDDAIRRLKDIIKNTKKGEILCIIHGYGSTGKGGTIRIKARQWLNAQLRKEYIKKIVCGEDFQMFNPSAIEIHQKDKETDTYYGKYNEGITLIEM